MTEQGSESHDQEPTATPSERASGTGRRHVWSSRRKRIEGKTVYVRVSMSEMERAQLLRLEAQTGLSPSAILVDAALGSGDPAVLTVRKQEVVTLLTIRRLIGAAANNMNQLARHANATGEVKDEALAAVQDARVLMRQIEAKMYELKP
ncbi:hypothetical protein IWX75_003471 [Arthrobacter sp. CAN_A6]|uniref:plasmid mobilization relaxosome protein MobC n=1 Tax=Arthrobacter sp. CAN_A6 TaxID=2787721 RepID=UPI001A202C75